jgi:putative transposase
MPSEPTTYPGYRFPAEVIHHAVWLYHLFGLSLRDIELILAERGLVVSYESIRRWCLRFGPEFAVRLRRQWPRPGGRATPGTWMRCRYCCGNRPAS